VSADADVDVQRDLFAGVRSLEAVEFAVLLDDGAARAEQVRGDVGQHVAVQAPMLAHAPP